ncbi:MAG: ribosomal protein S18 acetylase RimI-like enzyme [Candidatus Poriferisodalaceae bacterium]|jgi:ribosomal protein S18 acetylase RimI-like enzyme
MDADHFYIDNVAVDPVAQGSGFGARLLDLAAALARAADRSEIRLYTNEVMIENISYYVRRGFV